MFRTRCFLGLVFLASCISRGGGDPTPPPPDATAPDATVGMDATGDTFQGDRTPSGDRPACPPMNMRGAEGSARTCSDGLDNDCNGFADCDDFECRTCANPSCLTNNQVPQRDGGTCMCRGAEDTTAACSDGEDNDCDGFTDCQDFSCQACNVSVCLRDGGLQRGDAGFCLCRGTEDNNAACMDGVDNDCNGFADCRDFSCSRADAGAVTVCDAGSTPTDAGACEAGAQENTAAACSDGIDNDCDRFVDCEDFSCRSCAITACVRDGGVTTRDGGTCTCRGEENTNAACTDGVDNDCDGFVDCRDFDCTMGDAGAVPACADAGARDASAD